MRVITRRLRLKSTNKNRLVRTTPIIFDHNNSTVYIAPNEGSAGHYNIYDYMTGKGINYPETESHGYYYPRADTFHWYDNNFYQAPEPALENGIRTTIKALTHDFRDSYASKVARRLRLKSTNGEVPTSTTPVVFDPATNTIYIAPNEGEAAHSRIYEYLTDKGIPFPEKEAHGYYYPTNDGFYWYGANYGYFQPDTALENGIRTTIKALAMPPVPKRNFKINIMESEREAGWYQRPIIWDVDTDEVWLGPNDGSHWMIYARMDDQGTAYPEHEAHGYYYRDPNRKPPRGFYWYDHFYIPTPEEEVLLRQTIKAADPTA